MTTLESFRSQRRGGPLVFGCAGKQCKRKGMQDGFQLAIYNPCRAHSKTLAAIFEGVLFLQWRSFLEPLKVKELLIWKSMAWLEMWT
mmetsp:Transcript_53459/g.116735  ORF Transcript_53459/g.116735 Transcript_53459/m.116735 type:complete len:87 (+) Transcript_53459:1575-1835(+)